MPATQLPPGWYPDPDGKAGKLYWDGSEWYSAVPASAKHGNPRLMKAGTIAGVSLMGALILAGIVIGSMRRAPGPVPSPSASLTQPPSPTTTTSRYVSEKTMPADGVYRVGGDQVDPGVWESEGPAPGSPRCQWARLSAAQEGPENTVEAGGSDTGPTQAHIAPTDAAFSTRGCQPWRMVAR